MDTYNNAIGTFCETNTASLMYKRCMKLAPHLNALVSFIGYSELLCDLVVVRGNNGELLLNLGLAAGQVDVDNSQLVDAGLRLLEGLLDDALGTQGLRKDIHSFQLWVEGAVPFS